jgi:hypothetical protein
MGTFKYGHNSRCVLLAKADACLMISIMTTTPQRRDLMKRYNEKENAMM